MLQPPPAGFRSIGQEVPRQVVLGAAARGRLRRTLLVHGPRGAGKDAFVDDLLALLFCESEDDRPCNACRGCREARARRHPDLVVGSPAVWRARSGSESIVATARRWLADAAGTPISGEVRVVLIEKADAAGEAIQNTLLKALEEPGERQLFVLVADDPARLLPTIRSRAQPLRIGPVPRDALETLLVDEVHVSAEDARVAARISGGLPGAALRYARQQALREWRRRVQSELFELLSRGPAERLGSVRDLLDDAVRFAASGDRDADAGGDEQQRENEASEPASAAAGVASAAPQREAARRLLEVWIDLARDLMVAAAQRPELAPSVELVPEVAKSAAAIGPKAFARSLLALERAREGVAANCAPRLALEAAMLRWPRRAAA